MLGTIVVSGLVIVLVASTITGQRQARFDQGFEQSLQIAEVGLDRLVYLAESGQLTGGPDVTFADVEAAGGTFTATAVQSGATWNLSSTGVAPDGTERTVTVTARAVPFFEVGFFADEAFQASGTTTLGIEDDEELEEGVDGVGGSNDIVHFSGYPSMPIGAILLADWAANNDLARCTFNGPPTDCNDETNFSYMDDYYEIISEERDAYLAEIANGCTTLTGTSLSSLAPGDYCATTPITLENGFTVTGSGDVRLLLSGSGRISFAGPGGSRRVNWTGEASQLQVYSTDAIEVELASNSQTKALIYAPEASCYGQGTVEFHGALMCRVIDTGGNSDYFVPADIINITIDSFVTSDWRESTP
jgi:hypothetical protein